jgi:hypothetical protein
LIHEAIISNWLILIHSQKQQRITVIYAMPSTRTTKAPSRVDRTAEQANYAAWKILAGAGLLQRHDAKPGIIPERQWRKLYIRGMTPQKAADQAAVSANNTMSPADRLNRLKR